MTNRQEQEVHAAQAEYREQMILVGIRRGLAIEAAVEFAERCVSKQSQRRQAEASKRNAARLTKR